LAAGWTDLGSLSSTFAVLCTVQRWCRVVGDTSSSAFQKPRAPSPVANSGAMAKPRAFRSISSSRQLCALSRTPTWKPTSSFLPSGVAPISTNMHMWTAPSSQGVLQCFDQIACVHMSGLWVRSHMNAGQDGFRDAGSKHWRGFFCHWKVRNVSRHGSIDHTICSFSCKFWHQLSTVAIKLLPVPANL
jgi:hypothetical protein